MRNISAHERDWNLTEDIYNYDVIVINIPEDPGNETFSALISAADDYQVGLVFTNTWPGLSSPYGISLLQQYFNDPKGSYQAYSEGDVYYEVTTIHPIFDGWSVGEKISLINGGWYDLAWFYRYSGVTIADVGTDQIGPIGGGVAYKIRKNGNVHVLLAGLSQNIYTHISNAWSDEAKMIFIRAVTWASSPATLPPRIAIRPTSGPVGTKITVSGSGFAFNSSITVKFDDSPMATARANADGSFVAVFNVPVAEVGAHLVKALDGYGACGEAQYMVSVAEGADADVLSVEMDAGPVHFRTEAADFYVLTTLNGIAVDVTGINATVHKPDSTRETLTAEHMAAGIYLVAYSIPANASSGTYTLSIQADVGGVSGTCLRSFLVSLTLTDWSASLLAVNGDMATVQTDIGVIKVNLASADAKIVAVEGDMVIMETDIGEIKADVAYIKPIVENTNATVVKIEGDVATIETSVGEIQGTITSIHGGVAIVETNIGEVKANLPDSDGATSTLNSFSSMGLSVSSVLSGIVVAASCMSVLIMRRE